jgi:hypothetical protein
MLMTPSASSKENHQGSETYLRQIPKSVHQAAKNNAAETAKGPTCAFCVRDRGHDRRTAAMRMLRLAFWRRQLASCQELKLVATSVGASLSSKAGDGSCRPPQEPQRSHQTPQARMVSLSGESVISRETTKKPVLIYEILSISITYTFRLYSSVISRTTMK